MKIALWLAGLFCAAVLTVLLISNEGIVSFFILPDIRIMLSLNLFVLILALCFTLCYITLRAISTILKIPAQAMQWRAIQREKSAHEMLLQAITHSMSGRYIRAQKAAQGALARLAAMQAAKDELIKKSPEHSSALKAISHFILAQSAHALQDEQTSQHHINEALAASSAVSKQTELSEGIKLGAAKLALQARQANQAFDYLKELPQGATRRTAALRIKLKAARAVGNHKEALDTAKLLAKHGAFPKTAADSLLRTLNIELIKNTQDEELINSIINSLDKNEQNNLPIMLAAAQKNGELSQKENTKQVQNQISEIIKLILESPEEYNEIIYYKLSKLIQAQDNIDNLKLNQWLAVVEDKLKSQPKNTALKYLTGIICLKKGLWGKAIQMLENLPEKLTDEKARRHCLISLAILAEEKNDSQAANKYYKKAAQEII